MSKRQIKRALVVMEQLLQLTIVTWDGDLLCKQHMAELVESGCAQKVNGWNMLTPKGLRLLIDLNLLSTNRMMNEAPTVLDENSDEVRHEGPTAGHDASIDTTDDQT